MIYGNRSNGNQHGLVITKSLVVDVMLDRAGYLSSTDLSNILVIEPAAGDGAFAISIIERLYESSKKFSFSFQEALSCLSFFEIDIKMAGLLRKRIEKLLLEYSAVIPENLIQEADFLLANTNECDLIIGNPPYVRHENIPENQKQLYRKLFNTFTHRSDLYIAFYAKSLNLLKSGGILSFICSNRWLKNQYGEKLRELIGSRYNLIEIIDLEETTPFEEDVIAYPAITTIEISSDGQTCNYFKMGVIEDLEKIDNNSKPNRILETRFSKNWFSRQPTTCNSEKHLDKIEDQGFKIGIGVATGADKVFIRDDFHSIVENELLLPIITSKDLKNNSLNWSGKYIINPFSVNGDLIDLNNYPKASKYLKSHKKALEKRHSSKKNPKKWYKTIDKINQELTSKNKILLPDISSNFHLLIDRGEFYPHHNLYYISGRQYEKLVLLAAILMSDFVKNQLMELGNKMNGGYPRWQSQNLRKLKVPIIDNIPVESAKTIIEAYKMKDYNQINSLITLKEISNYSFSSGQTKLFEPIQQGYELGFEAKARHANKELSKKNNKTIK